MNLIAVPQNFISDGCTFPGILKILKGPLGAKHYHEYCREHDFLRRHGVIHWFKANKLLGKRIASTHFVGKLRAPFYVLFTTISYPWYKETQPLPKEWQPYADLYRN